MNILLRKATITLPGHSLNGKKRDILIENGVITTIGTSIPLKRGCQEVVSKNLHVSPGWFDLRANFGEPGFEERETIESGCQAAAKGGFTAVAYSPNNEPVTDNRATVEYLINQGEQQVVDIHPIGALSKKLGGQDLAEMHDMQSAGAVAFSDDKKGIQNAKFMQLALEYASGIDALVMSFPMENSMQGKAQVNEGVNSTLAGLKGIPHIAEELMVNRDLFLQDYSGGRLHFNGISSSKSADQIQKAKKDGQAVSCDVSVAQLLLNDNILSEFDSNYKVMPPLRTESDRKSLVRHIEKGTIDVICSDHTPHNIENKDCEFELSEYGMIGIQTLYPLLNTKLDKQLSTDNIIQCIALNPRTILGLEHPEIEEGKKANLTIFDPSIEWEYNQKNNASKSTNSPFLGQQLKGQVLGVINGKKGIIF